MKRLPPITAPGLTAPVVRVKDLHDAGVKTWRLYRSDKNAPLHGTRAAPGIDGTAIGARVAALQLLLTPGQFISRRSAAQLLEIPVPGPQRLPVLANLTASLVQPQQGERLGRTAPTPSIEVGAVRPRRAPQRNGIIGHQLRPGVLIQAPSAPGWLPTPADAWALLGAVMAVDDLIVAGDHLISTTRKTKGPGCTLAQLIDAAERFEGCQGVLRLREALPQLRLGSASPPETTMRLVIVRAGFPEPVSNCPVPTPGRVLHADLGYPQWRIAIEYEGAYHFENGASQAKFDNDRHERMRDAGWIVHTLTSLDLRDPAPFLDRLARTMMAAQNKRALSP